jgi:plastocyanin
MTVPRPLRRLGAIGSIALLTGLAACGGSDDEGSAAAGGGGGGGAESAELTLDATEGGGGLGFEPRRLEAPAGSVTIVMANPQGNQAPHAVALAGTGVDESGETVDAGGESTVTADLEAGEYTFYCPVGQHRQAGMEGTLTVE